MADNKTVSRRSSTGSFFIGALTGLALGVLISAGVAFYVSHLPNPFTGHSPVQSASTPDKPVGDAPEMARRGILNPSPVGSSTPPVIPTVTAPANPTAPVSTSTLPHLDTPTAEPSSTLGNDSPSHNSTIYFVQTGAFAQSSEAEAQRANLALIGIESTVLAPQAGEKPIYRVRIGPLIGVDEVRTTVATLRSNDIPATILKETASLPGNQTTH